MSKGFFHHTFRLNAKIKFAIARNPSTKSRGASLPDAPPRLPADFTQGKLSLPPRNTKDYATCPRRKTTAHPRAAR